MRELIVAEWLKLNGNRWVTGFLIWIYPVGAAATVIVMTLIALFSESFRLFIRSEPGLWTESAAAALALPTNTLGRTLLVSFAVIVFAGEYQWGTWKNIVPRTSRIRLIMSKMIALMLLVTLSCLLFALIWGGGRGLVVLAAGGDYGPPLSVDVIREFFADFGLRYILVVVTVFIAASQAALLAMLARSVIAGILFGIALAVAEPVTFLGLSFAAAILNATWLVGIGRLLPFYHFDNAFTWLVSGRPTVMTQLPQTLGVNYQFVDSLAVSLLALAIWAVVLPTLLVFVFRRQDITA